jgi:ABC-type sugar transport system substrate-binding protein
MNTLTTKASVFAALMAASAMAATSAKAEELVSLESAIEMMVYQQSKAVFYQVTQQVANSIEQEVGNFTINSFFASDKGLPTVSISATTQLNNEEDSPEE